MIKNTTTQIRERAVIEIVRLMRQGELKAELPKLTRRIFPGPNPTYRESIYMEREILMQRIKIYLGLDYEQTKNIELYELAEKLPEILAETSEWQAQDKIIQVIKEGCDACPSSGYYITELCRNCLEKRCIAACPKSAIDIIGNRAVIDKKKCVKCGLCMKACNFSAIVKLERPCKAACPVGAITEDEYGSAEIITEKCIVCGRCVQVCPFGVIEFIADLPKVVNQMLNGTQLVAIVAPAILGQFGMATSFHTIRESLLKIGFAEVLEAANGADLVAQEEAKHFTGGGEFMTTSCCPAFVEYINKYQPDYSKNISSAVSPMVKMGQVARVDYPDAKTVFFGPCLAKKLEAHRSEVIDYCITFEGLKILFDFAEINLADNASEEELNATVDGWKFACAGGVAKYVQKIGEHDLRVLTMNGMEEAAEAFKKITDGGYDLLEGMACRGGCINGPGIIANPKITEMLIKKLSQSKN
ncbi:MAG: monomeric [FeFe] hydrogenase [Negativicutes bacterium]|jgi:[FeFe] hydrogenase (group B1/B3)